MAQAQAQGRWSITDPLYELELLCCVVLCCVSWCGVSFPSAMLAPISIAPAIFTPAHQKGPTHIHAGTGGRPTFSLLPGPCVEGAMGGEGGGGWVFVSNFKVLNDGCFFVPGFFYNLSSDKDDLLRFVVEFLKILRARMTRDLVQPKIKALGVRG